MRRLLLAVACVAFAVVANGAEVRFGVETPVSDEGSVNSRILPRFARAGNHQLVAWLDAAESRIDAEIDGTPITIATVEATAADGFGVFSLTPGEDDFLVTWIEGDAVNAARVGLDGTTTRMKLSDFDAAEQRVSPPSAVFRNDEYIVAWAGAREIRIVHVSRTAVSAPVTIAQSPAFDPSFDNARLVTTAQGLIIAYGAWRGLICDPGSCWREGIGVGSPDDPGSLRSLLTDEQNASWLDLTTDGADRTTIVWVALDAEGRYRLRLIQLDPALTVVNGPLTMPIDLRLVVSPVRIIWNGQEYVVAWQELTADSSSVDLRALRLTRGAALIDGEPFTVAYKVYWTQSLPTAGPVLFDLIATTEGVELLYTRVLDDGDQRLYSRTIERARFSPRRRAAGR